MFVVEAADVGFAFLLCISCQKRKKVRKNNWFLPFENAYVSGLYVILFARASYT